MSTARQDMAGPTVFGHPPGLFTIFFAEMWERFSYYGMRALLVLYMIKGFLRHGDSEAYAVYGAYTALVYMTPFFGGILADRLLGQRRAVILGGLLMAAGHLMMTVETPSAFFVALALLITGNGFFKPNISTIVGSLYPPGSNRRDGGFTIFYMGINLGAAIAPLLCGYIGEYYGWHYGFGLATIGMLIGVAVFAAPTLITQLLIMAGAVAAAAGLIYYHPDNPISTAINVFVALSLLAAGVTAWVALNRGGVPRDAGAAPDPAMLQRRVLGFITAEWAVYLGTLVLIPVFALLVSGFALFTEDHRGIAIIQEETIEKLESNPNPWVKTLAVVAKESSRPAGLILMVAGVGAFVYLAVVTLRLEDIARERMYVVLVLTFFSMLFWAFFEQAGSSISNFTDRNVDRVFEDRSVAAADVGRVVRIQPTQEQLGYRNAGRLFTLDQLDALREKNAHKPDFSIEWQISADNVGMGLADRVHEIPASTFQSVNPICILLFGLVFTALWTYLGGIGLEPSTPVKFSLGLFQLGLGFAALWYGAQQANARGMVGLEWLLVGYLLHTTGELCLSPVGLAMITRLSPRRLVSTVMGVWFLATAFSQFLAAIIAQFTGVGEEGAGASTIPPPIETVDIYGRVFGGIALAAVAAAAVCLAISPLLTRWMHLEVQSDDARSPEAGRAAGH